MDIVVHHHGTFSASDVDGYLNEYIGGYVDVLKKFDCDLLSFRDLEDFAEKFKYSQKASVHFLVNGKDNTDGFRLLYDDAAVRDCLDVSKEYGCIQLYVDHTNTDDMVVTVDKGKRVMQSDMVDVVVEGEHDSEDEEDYDSDGNSDSDTLGSLVFESDDEELRAVKQREEEVRASKASKEHKTDSFEESEYDSEDLRSIDSSSEDENRKKVYVSPDIVKRKKIRKVHGLSRSAYYKTEWSAGMAFVNMTEFRDTVKKYALEERRGVRFVCNEAKRCHVKCKEGFPFMIWARKKKDSNVVEVKTLVKQHLCTKPYSNKWASVKALTERYGERLRTNPQWKVKEMDETIRTELEIDVPRIKVMRVRKAALDGVKEQLIEHYSRVWDFGMEILNNDPHNTVKICGTRQNEGDVNRFKRIYICYNSLKLGWKQGCRPLIGLDGCFIKHVCGGQLLSAVGRDGNNCMYPICYAVVEGENTDSWTWFLELLQQDLDLGNGASLSIISDQQKGLENAMKHILPRVEHRFCARHIYSNFRKRFPSGIVKKGFWSAACATHPTAHKLAMKEIEKADKLAFQAISKIDAASWSKAYIRTDPKADNIDNNMSECFNSWIIDIRFMPLLDMLQEIHFMLLSRIRKKRDEIVGSNLPLCPKIKQILDANITQSRKWMGAAWDGQSKFQVKYNTRLVTVDLEKRACDCRNFDLTGIPCPHALAAIYERRHQPLDYVSHYYKREAYLATYTHTLAAIRCMDFWEESSIEFLLPPALATRPRGRPKKLRRREGWEGGSGPQRTQSNIEENIERWSSKRVHHCSICKKTGHRKPKCPELPVCQEGTAENEGANNEAETDEQQSQTINPSAPQPESQSKPSQTKRHKLGVKGKIAQPTTPATSAAPGPENEGASFSEKLLGNVGNVACYDSRPVAPAVVPRPRPPTRQSSAVTRSSFNVPRQTAAARRKKLVFGSRSSSRIAWKKIAGTSNTANTPVHVD